MSTSTYWDKASWTLSPRASSHFGASEGNPPYRVCTATFNENPIVYLMILKKSEKTQPGKLDFGWSCPLKNLPFLIKSLARIAFQTGRFGPKSPEEIASFFNMDVNSLKNPACHKFEDGSGLFAVPSSLPLPQWKAAAAAAVAAAAATTTIPSSSSSSGAAIVNTANISKVSESKGSVEEPHVSGKNQPRKRGENPGRLKRLPTKRVAQKGIRKNPPKRKKSEKTTIVLDDGDDFEDDVMEEKLPKRERIFDEEWIDDEETEEGEFDEEDDDDDYDGNHKRDGDDGNAARIDVMA